MTQEALKLALDAMEEARSALAWFYDSYPQDVTQKGNELLPHLETVLTAIKAALAQPAQPPQRPWVELAPEDRLCAKYVLDAPEGIEAVIDYITTKLKEKNT